MLLLRQAEQRQAAGDVLALTADTRRAWMRAVATTEALAYRRQVVEAADAGAELARRTQAAGTHVNETALGVVSADAFDMAVMADESGKPTRYLFSTPPLGVPYVRRDRWRRLVVHVADVGAPGTAERLLDTLSVVLLDVPF